MFTRPVCCCTKLQHYTYLLVVCSIYGHVQYRAVACIHGLIPTRLVHFQKPIKPWSALAQSLFMVIEFLFSEEEWSGVCHFKAEYSCELYVGCASGRIIGFVCILKLIYSVGTYYFLTVINTFQVQQNFKFIKNLQEIVEPFLPLDKLKLSYTDVNSAKNFILNHVTFCQSHTDVSLWYQMLQWQVSSLVVQQFKFTVL